MEFEGNDISGRYPESLWYEPKHKTPSSWNEESADASGHRAHAADKPDPYMTQLLEKLPLAPGESVLDVGSGTGRLAVPLAKAGHRVYALDFSELMLSKLDHRAAGEGVSIETFLFSWDDDWRGVPVADVAIASRSLITDDLPHALNNLEGHARSRIVVTSAAAESPWRDRSFLTALGRRQEAASTDTSFDLIVEYLVSMGRDPRIDYIRYPRRWRAGSRGELVDILIRVVPDMTPREREMAVGFVDDHAFWNDVLGVFELDYEQEVDWGVATWKV